MTVKPFNDHFKFATDLTIIAKSNVSEIVTFVLILALQVRDLLTQEGPGYATGRV